MEPLKREQAAIVARPETDNFALAAIEFVEKGTSLQYGDDLINMSGRVLRGQSFAIRPLKKGQPYITLGDPFGIASRAVKPGDPIDDSNLDGRLPKLRVQYREKRPPPKTD